MTAATQDRSHVVWQLPLHGRRLIEASAGTGKTWTLTGLVVRLVLGLRQVDRFDEADWDAPLMPHQILVVTFTEAATAELRERVHARLSKAVQAFSLPPISDLQLDDAWLSELRNAVARSSWPAAQRRLSQALACMDEAAIHTLHSWALRTLKRHALESGQAFGASPVPHPKALHLQSLRSFWRTHLTALPRPAMKAWVDQVAAQPEHLLDQIKPRWAVHERDPEHQWAQTDWQSELQALIAWSEQDHTLAQEARAAFSEEALQALSEAVEARQIKKYQKGWLASRVKQLKRWLDGHTILQDQLAYWTRDYLAERNWSKVDDWPFFAKVQAHWESKNHFPQSSVEGLLEWTAETTWRDVQARKLALDQFEFNDLLRRLHAASHHPDSGPGFCAQVRQALPVALVDEFQDTDPWQYQSLNAIYPKDSASCWVMIGDPKQSIYRFRGANLPTYREARDTAATVHSLNMNFRSTPALVDALNHVFANPKLSLNQTHGAEVHAGRTDRVGLNQGQHRAMTVVQAKIPGIDHNTPSSRAAFHEFMAPWAAHTLVTHLQQGLYKPSQVAVLVRDKIQAQIVTQALAERGVSSVFLSDRNSVLSQPLAQDVWRLLCAIDQPQQLQFLRAAMATPLWALAPNHLEVWLEDDQQLEAAQSLCMELQQLWQRQGVLAALTQWLHASGAAGRLLASPEGERMIAQFIHLGEWVQSVSAHGVSRSSTLRRLSDEMQSPNPDDASAQARLHTDAPCVTVVTVHKSKGLEYDVVFVPFLSTLSRADQKKKKKANAHGDAQSVDQEGEDTDDAEDAEQALQPQEQQEEDLRLLYVALTRARLHLWVGVGEVKSEWSGEHGSALCALLQRRQTGDLDQQLQALWQHPHVHIESADTDAPLIPVASTTASATLGTVNITPQNASRGALPAPARRWTNWRVNSYSGLTRNLEDTELGRAADEGEWSLADEAEPIKAQFKTQSELSDWEGLGAGRELGIALHAWLEAQFNQGWPLARDAHHAASLRDIQRMALSWQLDEPASQRLLARLRELVNCELPTQDGHGRIALNALKAPHAWAEMPFTLGLRQFDAQKLDRLIQTRIAPGMPRPQLQGHHFKGMLTGVMDLVFSFNPNAQGGDARDSQALEHAVLDYKSNRIQDCKPQTLMQEVLAHRYDVQAVVYALALRRLIRHRNPHDPALDRSTNVLFWFVRGLAAGSYWVNVPSDLIEELDREWHP